MDRLTPGLLLRAYQAGIFPMGDDATGAIGWYAPDPRGILPLNDFHVPGTLAKLVRRDPFEVVSDRDFLATIRACADRERTWITPPVIEAYTELHQMGYAHSVECWQEGELVGGLYGVAMGGAFFGESMFFRVSNASKVALVHLVRQLRSGGYTLLDVQYSNPHLEQFGVIEIGRSAYQQRLSDALQHETTWWPQHSAPA
jgi:leucyl/phenylalanyl-tRNA--protein transferase